MNRVCSIFSQLLQLFSRVEFEGAVQQHKAERHARGFTCWGQFVAMLFCQLGRAHSLREICQGLAASEGKLKHLGVPIAPSRSTLAYANRHRPWQLYQTVFLELLARCQEVAHNGRRKFRFKNKLLSLDATVIDLCATLYDWAKFRRTKGATALGLTTRKGRSVSKQSFARMLNNPFYCGWIVSGANRYQGAHTPLIEEQLFYEVQNQLNGKSAPHTRQNEDFPLRRFVKCAVCSRPITAGWAKGRKEHYPRYWCWTQGCRSVKISRDDLETQFVRVLAALEPTAQYLAQLPDIARREWVVRKDQIAAEAKTLNKRMADQKTLNQKAVIARLNGEMSQGDFEVVKQSVTEEIERIQSQITLLDSEKSSMEDLIQQSNRQVLNFLESWRKAGIKEKLELQWALFPEGLTYSHEKRFFEPANHSLMQAFRDLFDTTSNVGVPDGI